jgi:multiple sugar transport system substrate-binding protein
MRRAETFRVAVREFGPFESAITRQWQAFEAVFHTGLTLDSRPFDLHALQSTLLDGGGLASADWDVAFLNTDWVPFVQHAGLVVDLAPLIRQDPPRDFPSGWTPSLLRLQEQNGKIAGVPYHDGPECLIFRRDLFEDPREQSAYFGRFGTPLRAPRTWGEFHQVARFFHRPAEGLYGTAFAAFPDGHNTVYDILLQIWSRGAEALDAAGNLQLDSPAAVAALDFYRCLLRDRAAVHPRCREMDSVATGVAFAAGEIAFMVNWFGFAAMAETACESRVKGRVAIALVPCDDQAASASLNVFWVLAIPAGSPHVPVAYEFLRHCMTPEMDLLLTQEGGIGCRKSTWQDASIRRKLPFYDQLENLHRTAREVPQLIEWPERAALIDRLVLRLLDSNEPVEQIVRDLAAGPK